MSSQTDPLAAYYIDDEEEEFQPPEEDVDPLAAYYEDSPKETPNQRLGRDVVSEELSQQGIDLDPGEEFERAAGRGTQEVLKGIASGATLGLSEYVPGMKSEGTFGAKTGEFAGSLLPITKMMKIFGSPLVSLAKKSPVLTKQLSSLATITGSAATGAAYKGATDLVKGEVPDTDDLIEHGAEWAAIDAALQLAGGTGRFVSAIFQNAKKSGKAPWQEVNDFVLSAKKDGVDFTVPEQVNNRVQSLFKQEPAQATKEIKLPKKGETPQTVTAAQEAFDKQVNQLSQDLKTKKVTNETIDSLSKDTPELAEPYFPKQYKALEIAEESSNAALEEKINSVAQRAATEAELGSNIKNDLETGLQEAKDSYKPAYDLAEEAAENITHVPLNTSKTATQILTNIESLATKPTGYTGVIKTLQTVLEDAGFVISRDETGKIANVVSEKAVPTKNLMDLGRRLNEIVNYDVIDKTVQDRLKPVVRAVKQDIRTALKQNKDALEMFENAEREFAETSRKFGTESLRKIRSEALPEKIAKIIKSPTVLADLKNTLTESQFAQVERELLENMRSMKEEKAKSFYREIRPQLSSDTQAIAEEIIESKMPKEAPSRTERLYKKIEESVFEDLSRASITGERPKVALNLWKTKEGQQIIKNSLKDNPNKAEVLKYLQDQSLQDFAASVVGNDGKINFRKFNDMLKDPQTLENLKMVGGEDAVVFFKNLQSISDKIKTNLSILEKIPSVDKYPKKGSSPLGENRLDKMVRKDFPLKSKAEDLFKKLGWKPQALLTFLGFSKFGVPGALETYLGYEIFYRLATSRKIQNALVKAAGSRNDPKALLSAFEIIQDEMEE